MSDKYIDYSEVPELAKLLGRNSGLRRRKSSVQDRIDHDNNVEIISWLAGNFAEQREIDRKAKLDAEFAEADARFAVENARSSSNKRNRRKNRKKKGKK